MKQSREQLTMLKTFAKIHFFLPRDIFPLSSCHAIIHPPQWDPIFSTSSCNLYFFSAVLSNINGGAPSDPCHFLKVTKTCEQPQVLAIVLPNSSINESKNKCMHAPGINLSMASSTSTLMPTPSAFLLQFSNLNFLGHQCLNPKLQHKEAHIANLSGKDEIK